MSNVLNFRTYRYNEDLSDDGTLMDAYDLNAMNHPEQMVCMYVRAMGWNIQAWVNRHYRLESADGQEVNLHKFIVEYNAHMASAILQYKLRADLENVKGAPGCTYKWLKSQINKVIIPNSLHGHALQSKLESKDEITTMAFDVRGLTIKQVSVPEKPTKPLTTKELIDRGESDADRCYLVGIEDNFRLPLDPEFGITFLPLVRSRLTSVWLVRT